MPSLFPDSIYSRPTPNPNDTSDKFNVNASLSDITEIQVRRPELDHPLRRPARLGDRPQFHFDQGGTGLVQGRQDASQVHHHHVLALRRLQGGRDPRGRTTTRPDHGADRPHQSR